MLTLKEIQRAEQQAKERRGRYGEYYPEMAHKGKDGYHFSFASSLKFITDERFAPTEWDAEGLILPWVPQNKWVSVLCLALKADAVVRLRLEVDGGEIQCVRARWEDPNFPGKKVLSTTRTRRGEFELQKGECLTISVNKQNEERALFEIHASWTTLKQRR